MIVANLTAAITACDSTPCANGGSCTPMEPFNFICQCMSGYSGPNCEVDIDDCISSICPNNSICEDGVNDFDCVCLPGYEKVGNSCILPLPTQSAIIESNTCTSTGQ